MDVRVVLGGCVCRKLVEACAEVAVELPIANDGRVLPASKDRRGRVALASLDVSLQGVTKGRHGEVIPLEACELPGLPDSVASQECHPERKAEDDRHPQLWPH